METIGVIQWLYRGYIGIGYINRIYICAGKEDGSYYNGLYRVLGF